MKKAVLEIFVDRKNEKGPGVFEHILIVLHKAFEQNKEKNIFKKILDLSIIKKNKNEEYEDYNDSFALEITKIGNKIRFFVISPNKYKNFLKNQIYAHYTDVEINEIGDYLQPIPDDKIYVGEISLKKHFLYPIKSFTELQEESSNETIDPYSSITSALGKTSSYTLNTLQINFFPARNRQWKKNSIKTIEILVSKYPQFLKKFFTNPNFIYIKVIFLPFMLFFKLLFLIFKKRDSSQAFEENIENQNEQKMEETTIYDEKINIPKYFINKISKLGYYTNVNLISASEDSTEAYSSIKELFSTLGVFESFGQNSFRLNGIKKDINTVTQIKNRSFKKGFILSTNELSGLVHLPTSYVKTPQINWVSSRAFEPPSNLPIADPDLTDDIKPETNLTPIGITNFRGTNISFGIGPDDRRRHIYIIGKTGMGKSTLLENMIIDDMRKGRGVAVIDPHGDLAESVLGFIPRNRTNSTIIFDPSDTEWPIAFNMLDSVKEEHRPLVASGLVGIFKKIFGDSWGPRLEHILRNTILALLEYPNTTLISIPLMLTSEAYRNRVVGRITDPVVKKFWTSEFAKMDTRQTVEATSPILNKVGQFLSSSILRNVLGQSKNSFSVRWAMDNKKIIIINLSKGKIGEDASALLGAMMVTKFQMDAMSRADISEDKREDFYLYVDEFQNFATDSFATILSEARKYKLNLVMANQYIDQMTEEVKGSIFGNVGSIVSFQVGYNDANLLKDMFTSNITEEDLMNLKKYNVYTKQLINGMPSPTFSAGTFAPNKRDEKIFASRYKKILDVSREKYSKSREFVVSRINKTIEEIEKQEKLLDERKDAFKKKKEEEKRKAYEERLKKQEESKG